jgi:hypothetical protein
MKIGDIGFIAYGALIFEVEVLQVKRAYGHDRYKVRPVRGTGETWSQNVRATYEQAKQNPKS